MKSVRVAFWRLSALFAASAWFAAGPALAQQPPTLILLNGKIWTENPQQREAEAVVITGNRITRVGNSEDMRKLAGPGTQIIDLNRRRVVPGFNDAHVHFFEGGASLSGVQLHDATTEADFLERLASFARTRPKGEWILGGNWDHERWTPAVMPTHQQIDPLTLDNPVFVNRLDGHTALANAVAMKLAGVDRNTPDIPGGVIGRDADGNPTGIFKDAAQQLIYRVIPPPAPEAIANAIGAAQRYARANGVTSVQDLADPKNYAAYFRVYQSLAHGRTLGVRVSLHEPLPDWKKLSDVGVQADFGNDMLHIGGLKGFADGSLGSTTAWMIAPYNDAPNTSGIASAELQNPEQMYADIQAADKAGLQIAIHAIGDRANRTILDFYQKLQGENGPRDRRPRIEHAQHLQAPDIARFGLLHVVASMQPYHCIDDGQWAEKRIGPERAKGTYAFRSLLDSGATLAFGSDWPVAPMEPLLGIYAAVTRRTLDGRHPEGWVPAQKITVAEAVHAYTMGSAFAEYEDAIKGSIAPDKLADLVVLSKDIFEIDPREIEHTVVDTTIFDGKIIYQRQQ